jgi:radical SAM family uncharacterized protein/radical SAM-linked protein
MQKHLEEKLFPFVIKPGRYTGGELGQIVKSPENRLKVALGYPDMYEIGMSYLGTQILYNIINADDRFLCERFYAPDRDAEQLVRQQNIPFFSLESFRPLAEFDLVGFTLAYEMVYTNLLNILELSDIPLRSANRNDNHPLVIAGGPVVHNPEPTAPFIDLYCVGDAEDTIIPILEIVHENRNLSRREKLERIVRKVPSVYVPQFYDKTNHRPLHDFAPPQIKSARIKELKTGLYPSRPMVPFIETVHDRLTVEIMRGCPRACRFCQATAIYRPLRIRPKDEIIAQVRSQIELSGYDEVTMLSLSSSDYPDILPLTAQLSRELLAKKVALSLPSLRPGTLTPELIEAVKLTRKTGLTFAPEAGTERLRSLIRKDITDQELYDTVQLAFGNGWNLIKLYFMIGLPTETDEDIRGIVQMIQKVSRIGREARGKNIINVTISPFSPKAHTPFQWDRQPSPDEIRQKSDFIRRQAGGSTVNIKLRDPQLSFLEGVFGRGGQELADVVETAFRSGARFDGWGEAFDFSLWMKAFETNNINPHDYLKERPFSEALPWSHIELEISAEHLMKERNRTSIMLASTKKPPEKINPAVEGEEDDDGGFGRSKKKGVQKNIVAPTKGMVRIRWGRKGLTRFLSHLDSMRVIERAIRRSGLPVEYSQGFHPHMKISYGPPLPLGFTSEAEYLDMSLERPFTQDMAARLGETLPEGYFLITARPIINTKISLSGKLNRAVYEIALDKNIDCRNNLADILGQTTVEVERVGKEETKRIDIRPAIYKLEYREESSLNSELAGIITELGIGTGGYVRPQEIIMAGKITPDELIPALLIHRRDVFYVDDAGNRLTPMEF